VFQLKGYPVVKSKVVLDRKTSKSLGYGYLTFHKQEEAEKCLKEMNNYVINGHAIVLSLKSSNKTYNEKANILVKNIDKSLS
jgi:RNA recognition motif-containing protein